MSLRTIVVHAILCCVWHTRTVGACDDCEVLVEISSGPICGSVRLAENATRYYAFQGIPYAKPPTGARRFAELQSCDPWEEPLKTVEEGPVCPQLDYIYGSIPVQPKGMLEDCIYANVFVPEGASLNSAEDDSEGLPILVNIHGGGFQTGSGNSDLHGPEYLMYKGKMIVMSFNYRLAVFGFLSLDSDKIPGNNGLRDMIFFLKWVQENARAFGGNPQDVTLIGQSVGSCSIHLLTLSEAAEGLFRRVIMMSGTAIPNFYSASPIYAKYVAGLFLQAAGINDTDVDIIHEQLIEMSLDDIMYANSIVQNLTGLTSFVPMVESDHSDFTKVIDAEPLTLVAQGRGCNIPMIVGFTNNEAAFFRRLLGFLNILVRVRENLNVVLSPRLAFGLNETDAISRANKVLQRYTNGTLTLDNIIKIVSHTFFVYPAIKLAQFRSALGCAPLYLYSFSYESLNSMIKRALWERYSGAAHVEDLTYIFRTNTLLGNYVSLPPRSNDDLMKDWMTDFVINFIGCNNPTCVDDESSPWPPADHTQLQLNSIAQPSVFCIEDLSDDYKELVNFFDSIDPDTKAVSDSLNIKPLK